MLLLLKTKHLGNILFKIINFQDTEYEAHGSLRRDII